jgi:hypothetical protein
MPVTFIWEKQSFYNQEKYQVNKEVVDQNVYLYLFAEKTLK